MAKTLTEKQAQAIVAFSESFDMHTTGQWSKIEEAMREDFGIEEPETELAAAIDALRY